ncbi:MAG: PqqD family protein [Frankiales bacterium]|nr:PqqD family protein [Frankiales bacterium]
MSDRYAAQPGIRSEPLEDGICLYNVRDEQVLVLNRTASDVWSLIADQRDVDFVCSTLAQRYQADLEDVRRDVLGVLSELADVGYLRMVDDSAPS